MSPAIPSILSSVSPWAQSSGSDLWQMVKLNERCLLKVVLVGCFGHRDEELADRGSTFNYGIHWLQSSRRAPSGEPVDRGAWEAASHPSGRSGMWSQ